MIYRFDTAPVYHMIFIANMIADLLQMFAALVFLPWYRLLWCSQLLFCALLLVPQDLRPDQHQC